MIDVALKAIQKHFKLAEEGQVTVDKMVVAYLKPETEEAFRVKKTYFSRLELEDQVSLLKNFKKVVAGKLDKNLYELSFKDDETSSLEDLQSLLQSSNLQEFAIASDSIINRILDNYEYEHDVCVHIINFKYDTDDQSLDFVLGTVNKAEQPKSVYILDIQDANDEGDFLLKNYLDPIIKTTPLNGFMYPSVADEETLNVSKVLVYNSKANETPVTFVDNVLGAEIKLTAKEEKDFFLSILRQAVGALKPSELSALYESINNVYGDVEDEFDRLMSKTDFSRILTSVFGEVEADLDAIYEEVIGVQNYNFKAPNILPEMDKKSIEIKSDRAKINIDPISLRTVKQVQTEEGEKFLLIKINGDSMAEGLSFESDTIETIAFNQEDE